MIEQNRSRSSKTRQVVFSSRNRSQRNTRRKRLTFETLESRQLLSINPIITEFMASNSTTLTDYYGKNPDWLEIYNPDSATIDLAGWKLKNGSTTWEIPTGVTLATKGYLKVFCDSRNTIAPNGELHTNFKLGAGGDYLGLLKPDNTVVSEFAPEYPEQFTDISYGLSIEAAATTLIAPGANAKAFVPTSTNGGSTLGPAWQGDPAYGTFNDSAWQTGTTGVGFASATPPAAANLKVRFNAESASGIVTDTSGASHNGTNVGASWVDSSTDSATVPLTRRGAMQFTSVENDQITIAPHADFSGATQGTISFWMRSGGVVGSSSDEAVLMDYRSSRGMVITQTYNGNIHLRCYSNSPSTGTLAREITSIATVGNNQWHHVTVTFNQSANAACSIYIDGVLDSSSTSNTNSWAFSATNSIELGRCSLSHTPALSTNKNYNGLLDDFRFYNTILSGNQIADICGGLNSTEIGLNLQSSMSGINSSVYLRIPFNVADPSIITNLQLSLRYNDGFVAWINGQQVASDNAPSTPVWNSTAVETSRSPERVWSGVIDDLSDLLQTGTNILAIQGLNNSLSNSTLLIVPKLEYNVTPTYGTERRFFVVPTPGAVNSAGVADLGPIVTQVTQLAVQPGDNDPIVVTANVRASANPVSTGTVTLHYRVMYNTELTVPMYDDGAHGDGGASDGVYGATIPASASTPGQMVRWYVTAADTLGNAGRWPLLLPIIDNDGGPEYEGTVIANPSVNGDEQVFESFIVDTAAADNWNVRTGSRASVFYLGEFYDNVFVRCRGGYTTRGNKFEFNSGYDFKIAEDLPRVNEINLNGKGSDPSYIRPAVGMGTYQEVGVAASIAFPLRVHRNNAYYGVMSYVEQVDNRFLDRNGLYKDGSLYKISRGSDSYNMTTATWYEKKNRDEEGYSDLQAFLDGLHLTDPTAKMKFVYDNVDLPAMINYMVGTALILSTDNFHKNYYIYRDTNDGAKAAYGYSNSTGTNEWTMFPWDMDLTLGLGYGISPYTYVDPTAHPLRGDSEHGLNWLFDAMLDIPDIRQMYLCRLRSMMDEVLQPTGTPYASRYFEQRLDEWYARLMGDPVIVSKLGDLKTYFDDIKNKYLGYRDTTYPGRRDHFYIDHSLNAAYNDYARIPLQQQEGLPINFGAYEVCPASGNQDQEYLTLINPNSVAIDLSGWKLSGSIEYTFKPGEVIPAGGTLYVSPNVFAFRQRTTGPSGNQGLLVQGNYKGHLSNWGETVFLQDMKDTTVATLTTPSNPSVLQQNLRITEIMFHPVDPPVGSTYQNDDFEFIELKNVSTNGTLNLSGVRFTDGIAFNFTGSSVTTLPPGARVLVVSNLAAFQTRYGTSLNGMIAGQFAKSLSTDLYPTRLDNAGEKITLVDSLGETILSFSYNDSWYSQTDGGGNSLVIRDATAADRGLWEKSEGWAASRQANGSPSVDELSPEYNAGAIVVNELLSHKDDADPRRDWVEFYNTTGTPINIGGWYLSNDNKDLKKYQITAGTIIPAYGYKAFNWRDHFGSTSNPGCTTAFTFGELGGEVVLTSAAGNVFTGFQTYEDFGSADTGVSFIRYIKSTGGKDFVAATSRTYEAANSAPLIGPVVINEIYYHPTTGKDTFIELKNLTALDVKLYDPVLSQNTWHLAEGVEFQFPAGAAIPASGYALIVQTDPAYFRTKYGISGSVPIFGPYLFELDKSGDTIELKYPDDPQPDGKVPYDRMDQVTYEDGGLWAKSADGFGASLNRITASAYGNDVANWTAGHPTPGAANAAFDTTTPMAPNVATAVMTSSTQMTLSWAAASDPQSGIAYYNIYESGNLVRVATTTSFTESSTFFLTGHAEISAVNNDGIESPRVTAYGAMATNTTTVKLTFSELLNRDTAQDPSHYQITYGSGQSIAVVGAVVMPDRNAVQLTLATSLAQGINYTATTTGIITQSGLPLPAAQTSLGFQYYPMSSSSPAVSVSITASDSLAYEAGSDKGSFTFTRSGGNLSSPFTVYYSVTGTASSTDIQEYLTGTAVFPANSSSVTVNFLPVSDLFAESTETVILSVLPTLYYTVSGTGYATASIINNNSAPTNLALSNASVAENLNNVVVGTLTTTDPNIGDTITYSLLSDPTNQFEIVGNSLKIKAGQSFDFEAMSNPSVNLLLRTTDAGGLSFDKQFTIAVTDTAESMIVSASDLPASGSASMTLKLGTDGKLHVYQTGTTIDFILPHVAANVTNVSITGRNNLEDVLTVDFRSGNPIPAGGVNFNGGLGGGNALVIVGTEGDDQVTMTTSQLTNNGSTGIIYSNTANFAFQLGNGSNDLTLDHSTLTLTQNHAISAGTKVIVNGGVLNFNGFTNTIGDITLLDNGQTTAASLSNTTTKVISGTLTVTSLVCDTLIIGEPPVSQESAQVPSDIEPLLLEITPLPLTLNPSDSENKPSVLFRETEANISPIESLTKTLPIENHTVTLNSLSEDADSIRPIPQLGRADAPSFLSPSARISLHQEHHEHRDSDDMIRTRMQSLVTLPSSDHARRIALQSIVNRLSQMVSVNPEDESHPDSLSVKTLRKSQKLVQKAVDVVHEQFASLVD